MLIVTDPRTDHQPVTEASYVNIPVIAFCNTDAPLRFVDIAIPCNTKSSHSAGLMWWMLAREVLRLRGGIPREGRWDVVVDLFFYRDPDESEKEDQQSKEVVPVKAEPVVVGVVSTEETWAEGDASEEVVPVVEAAIVPEEVKAGADDWSATTTHGAPAPAPQWGAAPNDWTT